MIGALPLSRLRHHLPVITFLAIGHLFALTLILVVPLYADGVNTRLLRDALRSTSEENRPRTSISLKHYASLHGPVSQQGFEAADAYIKNDLRGVTALATTPPSAYIYSDKLRMYPADLASDLGADPIDWSAMGFDDTLFDRIEMTEGRLPERRGDGETLEVILSQTFINKHGLRAGDVLVMRGGSSLPDVSLQVQIVGVWQAKAPVDERWPLLPFAYEDVLIVPRETYMQDVAPVLNDASWYSLVWYTTFPADSVNVSNTGRVRAGLAELQGRSARLLGGRMDMESPDQYLAEFQSKAANLRTLLWVFSIPTLVIVFLYIISTSSLFAERQRAEIAVLKGRGTSKSQIVGAYFVEGAVVDIAPLILGPLLAFVAAQLIGRTVAFLQFGDANALPLRMTMTTLQQGLLVLVATLLLGLTPVFIAAQQTLISYQQQVARSARPPIWQRMYLDILILIAAGYGYYTLRSQGSLVPIAGAATADPFSNPLSLLLPATALLGASLLSVRLFPLIAAAMASVGQRFVGATTLLALRHLARSPEQGRSIVLLTVLTLALGSFSASMATTLDQNDADRIAYATGGDVRITERAELSRIEERWTTLPAWEHGDVPGVQSWSRVHLSDVSATVGGGGTANGELIALDRAGYATGGWWREDLATASLGRVMNVLAAEPQAVVVSRGFLGASRLRIGDTVTLTFNEGNQAVTQEFLIRDAIDSFPMVYPEPGEHFFVANYDYVHMIEDPATYDVILKLEPGADTDAVVQAIQERGFTVDGVEDAKSLIAATRARPERVGFVGLLSLGFVAATGLTMLALLLYSLFSFRRRMVQIGVLRAAGLSMAQLIWLLAFELCFLTITSAVAGTALGIAAARLFVPFYQLGNTIESRTPSFIVVIAWSEIGRLFLILGAMLVVTLLATTLLLRRLRIHEAIKLGQELG
jgi:putative ABC transport system permease protein